MDIYGYILDGKFEISVPSQTPRNVVGISWWDVKGTANGQRPTWCCCVPLLSRPFANTNTVVSPVGIVLLTKVLPSRAKLLRDSAAYGPTRG